MSNADAFRRRLIANDKALGLDTIPATPLQARTAQLDKDAARMIAAANTEKPRHDH